jgi:6 kDa early secretory antigenic target
MSGNSDLTTAITYETVTQAASDTRKTSSDLVTKLTDLMGQAKAVAEHWDGEAKEAYITIQNLLTKDLAGMTDQLTQIARALDDAVIGYQDTDKGNAGRFRMDVL